MEDRERIGVALAAAAAVHVLLYFVFPEIEQRRPPAFLPPLYVALDPVNREAVTEEVPQAPPPATRTRPSLPTEPAPASTPADRSSRESRSSLPTEPAPPPSPPRERSFDPAAVTATTTANAEIRASRIEEITRLQEEYLADLAEWRKRQDAGSAARSTGASDEPRSGPGSRSFQDALSRAIDGIRHAKNVVAATTDGAQPGSDAASDATGDEPPDGISIGDGDGRRSLVVGGPPDLSDVSLPPGFPPEYLVTVTFDVGADGWVRRARLKNATPVPQLDEILRETIESWRFAPARGAGVVSGSVTIVIDASSTWAVR